MTYHDAYDYDGDSLTVERDWNTGATVRRHVHGPGIDEPLVTYQWNAATSGFERRWPHADERGSVIALSDDAGAVTNVNSYDEYGIPAAANTGRFQYTGLPWLPQLGMQSSRNRIYSPTMGEYGIPVSANTCRFQYTGLPWLSQLGMRLEHRRDHPAARTLRTQCQIEGAVPS